MTPPTPLGRLLRRVAGVADAAVLAVALGMIWTAVGLNAWDNYTNTMTATRTESANLTRAFAESAVRTVREIDQTLRYVRAMYQRDGAALDLQPWVDSTDPEHRLAMQISISGRDGLVVMSNLRPMTERIDLSERPHFRHFVDHPVDELYISVPLIGRVSNRPSIQFVRMLTTKQGDFDGIVVLSVDPSYLVQFYRSVDIGKTGRVTLIGLDGVVRAGAGINGAAIGSRSNSPAIARVSTEPEGTFDWTDPADGVRRLTHFQRVAGTTLLVEVDLPASTILRSFDENLRVNLLAGPLLSLAVIGIGLIARHQKRRVARAQLTMNAALENISQGLIMVNEQGRIAVMNQRARDLLDIPEQFRRGDDFRSLATWQRENGEFAPGTAADIVERIRDDPRPELTLPDHYKRTRPNGTVLEVVTQILPGGAAVRTFADVTAWEQSQAALTTARDAAEAGLRARAQFLAVMSHEIRTPLNGVIGVADLLHGTALSEQQAGYVRVIKDSGSHLLEIVNDILDFSRLEHGKIDLETIVFEPRVALIDVMSMFAQRADESGLDLSSVVDETVPSRVVGDLHRFRQVLLNLVGNAVKFTERGTIDVSLSASLTDDASGKWRLRCRVCDTGIGMSPEVTGLLFQEFTQIDGSITRRFGGTGLGLAICRRLVEAMGGSIGLESTPGVGSVFYFEILVDAAAEQVMIAAPTHATSVLPPLRVLLAEDNRVNRIVATAMLEKLGCSVSVAEDGRKAVEAIRNGGFELVVMDVMMPHMDGLAATRAIRSLPGPGSRIPIIGLTANAFRSDADACRQAGMDGFVAKPVTLERLADAIAGVLRPTHSAVADPDHTHALAELVAMLGEATVAEMIAAFREELPVQLLEMRRRAAAGDPDGVARTAHALAGSAATIGCTELAAATRALEQALRTENVDNLAERLDRIEALARLALDSFVYTGLAA